MHHLFISGLIMASLNVIVPFSTQAKVATLNSMTCDNDYQDITPSDEFYPAQRSSENYQVFWFYIKLTDGCEMQLSFDEMPLMVFVSGGAMTENSNWTRDSVAGTATVNFTARFIQQVDAEVEKNYDDDETLTTVAFIWESDSGDGPDQNVDGAWVATDFQEYQLIADDMRMGAQVRGDEGDAGLFAMYMPATAVTSYADNAETDMAIYLGDEEQTDETVTASDDGGVFVQFSPEVKAEYGVEAVQHVSNNGPVQVRVTVGPRDVSENQEDTIAKDDMSEKRLRSSSVRLGWPTITGVSRYVVQVRTCERAKEAKCALAKYYSDVSMKYKKVKMTRKDLSELTPATYYQWRVKGCIQSRCGNFSDWKRFKTKAD